MVIVLALLAAVAYAVSSVLEQRAASEVPEEHALRPGLLLRLVRRPMWLIGTLVDWMGFGFQALALGLGSLILVDTASHRTAAAVLVRPAAAKA